MIFQVISQMGVLIVLGVLWRAMRPGGVDADSMRRALTTLVYYLLLPALVLQVLWTARLGIDSIRIAVVAAAGILAALALSRLLCRWCSRSAAVTGAIMLASAFPNATYLGLPVLNKLFGEAGKGIAIQYDLFACTPLLLTVGILVARHFGQGDHRSLLSDLLRVPPLWAAVLAMALNFSAVPLDPWFKGWLEMLAAGVVPLMLFSLGLSLRWDAWRPAQAPALVMVAVLQLLLVPLLAWGVAHLLGLTGIYLKGVVLEAAMPTMVLGLVLCDRFKLDTGLYAAVVTLTTALSLITLPLWYGWLS